MVLSQVQGQLYVYASPVISRTLPGKLFEFVVETLGKEDSCKARFTSEQTVQDITPHHNSYIVETVHINYEVVNRHVYN
jgi:hypothetical protein